MSHVANLSRYHGAPAADLSPLLEEVDAGDPLLLDRLSALLRNRAIRLIRSGVKEEIREEAAVLSRFLYSRRGRQLLADAPVFHARQQALADMLTEVSERKDATSLQSVIGGRNKKYAQTIIEILATEGEMSRSLLRARLGNPSESNLSHMLRDLEEAGVVERRRVPNSKEIVVALGAVGRDVIEDQLLPRWFVRAMDLVVSSVTSKRRPDSNAVATDLERANAPSRMIVQNVLETIDRALSRQRSESVDKAKPTIAAARAALTR